MANINYSEYLGLDKVLNAQSPLSFSTDTPAHDEMLFITTHQSYEIWFKQILFELDTVLQVFGQDHVDEASMGSIVQRLQRMVLIFKNLITQVDLLETMTPLDFLEFRHLLYPASGFQSLQFRLLENKLGLKREERLSYNDLPYTSALKPKDQGAAEAAEKAPSLFDCMQAWLERTPFLKRDEYPFWDKYLAAVEKSFEEELNDIEAQTHLSEEDRRRMLHQVQNSVESFRSLFDDKEFELQRSQGSWKLSYSAVRAALLIQLYRDQPVFQSAFALLTAAQDLDAQLTQWRYRHALMAQRMLGRKIGTGGSSGASYLRSAAEKHRVFQDLYQLTSFFIPRSKLPPLSEKALQVLGFYFTTEKSQ